MFSRGATPGKVKTWCYDEDAEDFTKGNNTHATDYYMSESLTYRQMQQH
jgi:hypothetical protein